MNFSDRNFQIWSGLALFIVISFAYYYLLVVIVGEFSTLFKGFEIESYPIHTNFILSLANFWWLFSLIVIAGGVAIYQKEEKIGYILYAIPLALLVIIVPLTVWAMYSPIFALEKTF